MKWVVVFLFVALLAINGLSALDRVHTSGTSSGSKYPNEDGLVLAPEEAKSRQEHTKERNQRNNNERTESQSLQNSNQEESDTPGPPTVLQRGPTKRSSVTYRPSQDTSKTLVNNQNELYENENRGYESQTKNNARPGSHTGRWINGIHSGAYVNEDVARESEYQGTGSNEDFNAKNSRFVTSGNGYGSSDTNEDFNVPNQGENSGKHVNRIYSHGADNVRYISGTDSNDFIGGVLNQGPNKLHIVSGDQEVKNRKYMAGARAGTGHENGDLSAVLNRGLNKPRILSEIVNPGTVSRKYFNRISEVDNIDYVAGNTYSPHQNEYLYGLLNQARDAVDSSSGTVNPGAVPVNYENGILPQEGSTGQYAVVESQDANSKYISDILTQVQRLLKYGAVPSSYGVTSAYYRPISNKRWSVYRPLNHGIRVYDATTGSYMTNPSSAVIDDEGSFNEGIPAYVIPAPGFNGYPNRPGYYSPSGPGYMFGTDRTVPTTIFGRNPEGFYRRGPVLIGGGTPENNDGNGDVTEGLFDKTLTNTDYVVVPFDNNDEGTSTGASETVIGTDKTKYGTRSFRHDGRLKRDGITTIIDKDLKTRHLGSDNDSEIENGSFVDKNLQHNDKHRANNGKVHESLTKITEAIETDNQDTTSNNGKSTVVEETTVVDDTNNHNSNEGKKDLNITKINDNYNVRDGAIKRGNSDVIENTTVIENTYKVGKKNDKTVKIIEKDERLDITGNNDDFIIKDSESIPIKDTVKDGKDNGKKAEPVKTIKKVTGTKDGSDVSDNDGKRITKTGEIVVIKNITVIKNTNKDGETNNKKNTTVKTTDEGSGNDENSDLTGSNDDGITKTRKTIVIKNSDKNGKSNEKEDTIVTTIEKGLKKDDYENDETKQDSKFVVITNTTVVTKTYRDGGGKEIVDESLTAIKKVDGKDIEGSDDQISKGDKPRVTIKVTRTKSIEKGGSSNGKESSVIDKISKSKNDNSEEGNEDKNDDISSEDYVHDDDDDDDDNDASKSIEGDKSSETRNHKNEQSTKINKVLEQKGQNNGIKINSTDSKSDRISKDKNIKTIKTTTGTNEDSKYNIGDNDTSKDDEIGENGKTRVTIRRTVTKSIEKGGSSNGIKLAVVDQISQTKKDNSEESNEDHTDEISNEYYDRDEDNDESDEHIKEGPDDNKDSKSTESDRIIKRNRQKNGYKNKSANNENGGTPKDGKSNEIDQKANEDEFKNDVGSSNEDNSVDDVSDASDDTIKAGELKRNNNKTDKKSTQKNDDGTITADSQTYLSSDNGGSNKIIKKTDQNEVESENDSSNEEYDEYDNDDGSSRKFRDSEKDEIGSGESVTNDGIKDKNNVKTGQNVNGDNKQEHENSGGSKNSHYIDDDDSNGKSGESDKNDKVVRHNSKKDKINFHEYNSAVSENDGRSKDGKIQVIINKTDKYKINDRPKYGDSSSSEYYDEEDDDVDNDTDTSEESDEDSTYERNYIKKDNINNKVDILERKGPKNDCYTSSTNSASDGTAKESTLKVIIKKADQDGDNDGKKDEFKNGDGSIDEYYDDNDADGHAESDEDGTFGRIYSKIDQRNNKIVILERKRQTSNDNINSTGSRKDETSKDEKSKVIGIKSIQDDVKKYGPKNGDGPRHDDDSAFKSVKGKSHDKKDITFTNIDKVFETQGQKNFRSYADCKNVKNSKNGNSIDINITTGQDENNGHKHDDGESSSNEDSDKLDRDGRSDNNKDIKPIKINEVLERNDRNINSTENDAKSTDEKVIVMVKKTGQDENNVGKKDEFKKEARFSNDDYDNADDKTIDKSIRDDDSDRNGGIQGKNNTKTDQIKKSHDKKEASKNGDGFNNKDKDSDSSNKFIEDDKYEKIDYTKYNRNNKADRVSDDQTDKDSQSKVTTKTSVMESSKKNKSSNNNHSAIIYRIKENERERKYKYNEKDFELNNASSSDLGERNDDGNSENDKSIVLNKKSDDSGSNSGKKIKILPKTDNVFRQESDGDDSTDSGEHKTKKNNESIMNSKEAATDNTEDSESHGIITTTQKILPHIHGNGCGHKNCDKQTNKETNEYDSKDEIQNGDEDITSKLTNKHTDTKDDNGPYDTDANANQHGTSTEEDKAAVAKNNKDVQNNQLNKDSKYNSTETSKTDESAEVLEQKNTTFDLNNASEIKDTEVTNERIKTDNIAFKTRKSNKSKLAKIRIIIQSKSRKTKSADNVDTNNFAGSKDTIDFRSRRDDGHGRNRQESFRGTANFYGCRRCDAATKPKQNNTSARRCFRTKTYGPKIQKEEYNKSPAGTESVSEESLVKEGKKNTYKNRAKNNEHNAEPEDSKYTEEFEDSESKGIKSGQDNASEDGDRMSSDSFIKVNNGEDNKKLKKDFSSKDDKTKPTSSGRKSKTEDSNGNITEN